MRRIAGFALLCAAVGMLIIILVPSSSILQAVLFFTCLASGYMLFCK